MWDILKQTQTINEKRGERQDEMRTSNIDNC